MSHGVQSDAHGDQQHPSLDATQLGAVWTLETERVPEPERLAIDANHPLLIGILDPEVVSEGQQLLSHQLPGGTAAETELASVLTSLLTPISQTHRTPPRPLTFDQSITGDQFTAEDRFIRVG
jgi:hypothetical protein